MGAALSSNVLAVALLVALAGGWLVWLVRRARGADVPLVRLTPTLLASVTAAFLVFGVLRNTPWGAWLAP